MGFANMNLDLLTIDLRLGAPFSLTRKTKNPSACIATSLGFESRPHCYALSLAAL